MKISSITGKTYTVEAQDDKGWTLAREGGSTVRVTRALVDKTRARLEAGERIRKQASGPKGGISYTVAVEAGVLAILAAQGLKIAYDRDERVFTLAEGA